MPIDEHIKLSKIRVIYCPDKTFENLLHIGKAEKLPYKGSWFAQYFKGSGQPIKVLSAWCFYADIEDKTESILKYGTKHTLLIYVGENIEHTNFGVLVGKPYGYRNNDIALWLLPHGFSLFMETLDLRGFVDLVVNELRFTKINKFTLDVSIVREN